MKTVFLVDLDVIQLYPVLLTIPIQVVIQFLCMINKLVMVLTENSTMTSTYGSKIDPD